LRSAAVLGVLAKAQVKRVALAFEVWTEANDHPCRTRDSKTDLSRRWYRSAFNTVASARSVMLACAAEALSVRRRRE